MRQQRHLWITIGVGLILLSCNFLFSQKQDTIITIPRVDIVAEKPLNERVIQQIKIDTSLIQNYSNNSLSDLINNHTPIFVKTYGQGSLATVSFRGTGASHTAVEWNGININNPMLGQVDFSQLPILFIDQIEILPGSSSLQNNSGALGGSVNISSQPKFDETFYGMAGFSYGSFNTKQYQAQFGGGTKKWQNRLRLFQESSDNDFVYYNNANGLWNYETQKNASYQKKGALGETHYHNKKNLFSLSVWYHESERNLPPIMSFQGMKRIEYQNDKDIRSTIKWKHYFKNGNNELMSGVSIANLNYYLAHQTQVGLFENYKSESNSQSYFVKNKMEYVFMKNLILRWNANYDFVQAQYIDHKKNQEFSPHRNSIGNSMALFYEHKEKTSCYLLIRNEMIDNVISPIMPAAGFEIKDVFIKGLNIKTNASSNYHQPSLNDMYWNPGGNPDLKPEKSKSIDSEISFSNPKNKTLKYQLSTSFYASLVDDWIIWQPSEYRYWTAQNIHQVFARGIETKAEIKSNFKKVNFIIFANYSMTKTQNIEKEENKDYKLGNQLIYIPINKANAFVSIFFRQYQFSYTFSYVGKRYTSANNSDAMHYLPGHQLHHIGLSKKWNFNYFSPSIELKINNLLNEDYQAILWRAMPKRNYAINLKINF